MNEYEYNTRDIGELREDLDALYKTVYQGNGAPSLVTQVSKLEHRMTSLEEKLDDNFAAIDTEMTLKFKNITDVVNERFNHISYQIAQEFEKKRHDTHYHLTFRAKAFSAGIAGVCSLVAVLIAEILKR